MNELEVPVRQRNPYERAAMDARIPDQPKAGRAVRVRFQLREGKHLRQSRVGLVVARRQVRRCPDAVVRRGTVGA